MRQNTKYNKNEKIPENLIIKKTKIQKYKVKKGSKYNKTQ